MRRPGGRRAGCPSGCRATHPRARRRLGGGCGRRLVASALDGFGRGVCTRHRRDVQPLVWARYEPTGGRNRPADSPLQAPALSGCRSFGPAAHLDSPRQTGESLARFLHRPLQRPRPPAVLGVRMAARRVLQPDPQLHRRDRAAHDRGDDRRIPDHAARHPLDDAAAAPRARAGVVAEQVQGEGGHDDRRAPGAAPAAQNKETSALYKEQGISPAAGPAHAAPAPDLLDPLRDDPRPRPRDGHPRQAHPPAPAA